MSRNVQEALGTHLLHLYSGLNEKNQMDQYVAQSATVAIYIIRRHNVI